MGWTVVETFDAVADDGQLWQIDLLTGETKFESRPAGKTIAGVMASAHQQSEIHCDYLGS